MSSVHLCGILRKFVVGDGRKKKTNLQKKEYSFDERFSIYFENYFIDTEIIDFFSRSFSQTHLKKKKQFNFVGKLLGPKGNSMKRLQEDTMCKMAVLGRGSMKDRKKEEELRLSGDPRYTHLFEDLHVEISTFAAPAEAYARIAYSLAEVRRFLVPVSISIFSFSFFLLQRKKKTISKSLKSLSVHFIDFEEISQYFACVFKV